jgi:hypothetical protein
MMRFSQAEEIVPTAFIALLSIGSYSTENQLLHRVGDSLCHFFLCRSCPIDPTLRITAGAPAQTVKNTISIVAGNMCLKSLGSSSTMWVKVDLHMLSIAADHDNGLRV